SFNAGPGASGQFAPDYVAPERLVGREVDGRADVYSLAAVIFEATSGRRPFSSKSWIETLSRRLYESPPNVREVAPDLPPGFALELQQAMDRDPDRRPPTAGDLPDGRRDLLHYLLSRDVQAEHVAAGRHDVENAVVRDDHDRAAPARAVVRAAAGDDRAGRRVVIDRQLQVRQARDLARLLDGV